VICYIPQAYDLKGISTTPTLEIDLELKEAEIQVLASLTRVETEGTPTDQNSIEATGERY
jgi:hypothetical protein